MRFTKRISAVVLVLAMLITLAFSAATTATAISGGGFTGMDTVVAYGIDLSYWNFATSSGLDYSCVDFAELLADGVDYAIIRIGYGSSSSGYEIDDTFVQVYNNAREAGMPLGLYFYSYATTYAGAAADAEWVIGIIEQYDMYFEYPIYYDVEEDDQEALDSTGTTNLCLGWCETLESAGYFPGIYTGYYYIEDLTSSFRSTYDVWIAQVASASSVGVSGQYDPVADKPDTNASMWQYSWFDYLYDGYYPPTGMENALDVNVAYKDYPTIMTTYGYNNMGVGGSLAAAIGKAANTKYTDYSEKALEALHEAYLEAIAIQADENAGDAEKEVAAAKLLAAIDNTASKETILSTGKSYTTTAPNRTGDAIDWNDDGVRLTDGDKGVADVINSPYSAWAEGVTVDVTVDLGSVKESNVYRLYAARYDEWELAAPSRVTVSVSNDGTNFTKVDFTGNNTQVSSTDTTVTYCYSIITEEAHSARYIRFTVTPSGNHTWLDEVEVAYNSEPPYTGGIHIDGFNDYILSGMTYLYTPDFGEITVSSANHAYTANAVAKWSDDVHAYVVTQVFHGSGVDTTPSITLADDEIFIASHDYETGITDGTAVEGSAQNRNNVSSLVVGDVLTLNGIDIENKTLNVAPYIGIDDTDAVVSIGAKANTETGAVRFGAQYTKITANGEVSDLGFLLISKYRLGSATLDLNYASNNAISKYVVRVTACGIEEYDANRSFEDYASFTFYATVVGVGDAYADENIVAVPYIIYKDGTSCIGAEIMNSYNGIIAGNSSFN